MMLSAQEISGSLMARKVGRSWIARCPAHDDKKPSLSISEKDGKVLVKCWAGCSQEAVIGALKDLGLWQGTRTSDDRAPAEMTRPDDPPLPSLVASARVDELLYTLECLHPTSYSQVCAYLEEAATISYDACISTYRALVALDMSTFFHADRWREERMMDALHEGRL